MVGETTSGGLGGFKGAAFGATITAGAGRADAGPSCFALSSSGGKIGCIQAGFSGPPIGSETGSGVEGGSSLSQRGGLGKESELRFFSGSFIMVMVTFMVGSVSYIGH
jgi:hypothetical protein